MFLLPLRVFDMNFGLCSARQNIAFDTYVVLHQTAKSDSSRKARWSKAWLKPPVCGGRIWGSEEGALGCGCGSVILLSALSSHIRWQFCSMPFSGGLSLLLGRQFRWFTNFSSLYGKKVLVSRKIYPRASITAMIELGSLLLIGVFRKQCLQALIDTIAPSNLYIIVFFALLHGIFFFLNFKLAFRFVFFYLWGQYSCDLLRSEGEGGDGGWQSSFFGV